MSFAKNDRNNQSTQGKSLHSERFSDAIARALHREFDQTHSAIKTVVALTGANERAVRNWFEAKNGPNGEFLIALCRHSDQVLETFLLLAGRTDHLRARKIAHAKDILEQILILVAELEAEAR
jgi:membrane protein required for beta-lactamase induction